MNIRKEIERLKAMTYTDIALEIQEYKGIINKNSASLEVKTKKEEKALEYAKYCWGDTIDMDNEMSILTNGELTKKDYLAGYEQAIKDFNIKEVFELLNHISNTMPKGSTLQETAELLIKNSK